MLVGVAAAERFCNELWADLDQACLWHVLAVIAGPDGVGGTDQGLDGDIQPCTRCELSTLNKISCVNLLQCLAYNSCSINTSYNLFPPLSFSPFQIYHFLQDFVSHLSAPLSIPCLGPVPQSS